MDYNIAMRKLLLLAILLGAVAPLAAQQYEVPVFDLPYNAAHGLRAPSMEQSLALTADVYDASHVALQEAFGERRVLGRTAVALFDLVTMTETPLPLTDAWLHEEWHRAVLGRRGIDSFDDVYKFRFGETSIAVSHVRDEDLIALKRDHPSDLIRLGEAGIEGEQALVQRLEKEQFFAHSEAWHLPLYWLVKISTQSYVASGVDRSSDEETDRWIREEGTNIPKRDFTGHDFLGWMYDLSRPNEPYEARGIHPSGVGINRYRKTTDLTPHERAFLKKQGQLQWINFADPNLAGFSGFETRGVRWNATASHTLTSFGYAIDANVFLATRAHDLFVTLHRYSNDVKSFPGAEAELVDEPLTLAGHALRITPRVAVWQQPDGFRDASGSLGALGALRVDVPMRGRYGAFFDVEAKSAGWVQGVEALESNLALRFGVTFRPRA